MTNHYQATETETKEVMDLLPEEIADLLSEQALAELQEAKKVPFTPVEDAAKLDALINSIQKKLLALLSLDIDLELKRNLEGFAELENESGETNPIALLHHVTPPLETIIAIEAKVSAAISRYQKSLVECLKMKRMLSGQMFGTRLAHSAQVSRMKRVRQITVTGHDLLNELTAGGTNPRLEMEPVLTSNVIEIFPKATSESPTFEPIKDTLPFEAALSPKQPEQSKPPAKKIQKPEEGLYCSSYED